MTGYTKLYDFALRQSLINVYGICYTTDFIQVVGLNYTTYDTTRLYASFVLQMSRSSLGAIQMICDTLGEKGEGTVSPNVTWGREALSQSVT